ncbi:transporter substrate-binding domain-containing protein [Pseudodesulfovibrio sp. zrk46]|uniref:substrate-binding periplasmic protein n=1 Tax=Pseudodesulfovibrio sp. zrk46 TaxID=2725288 RepID=UPI001448EB7D|nr:transporter substrate-binding domain-containing protein [Pseudodesulfovibrio sp. zrk46]QJB55201.1 amino acid ABC transporter substrate-binding protein [Pseudodesulfovibrio sp. zrk46]
MRLYLIALLLFGVFLPGLMAAPAGAEELRVAYIKYPPFNYPKDGKAHGTAVELVRQVCQKLGLEPVFQPLPFARLLYEMKTGEVHCAANLYWNEERAQYMEYVPFSSIYEEIVVYVNNASGFRPVVLDDLHGHDVGAVRGYHYGEGVLEKLGGNVVFVKDSHTLYKMLAEGRFDVALGNRYGGAAVLNELGHRDKVRVMFSLARQQFFVAFSKTLGAKGHALANQFAIEMQRIAKENGESED